MARATLSGLIARLRSAVGDPAGASQTWTDDELQDFLDVNRQEVRHAQLRPETTWANGVAVYTDYYADCGNWEADVVLEDGMGTDLTPKTADLATGHWAFTEQEPPVYVTGKSFDLWAAVADVLEAWAARVALDFDFTADGSGFQRSQKREALLAVAAQYRRRARPRRAMLIREDLSKN